MDKLIFILFISMEQNCFPSYSQYFLVNFLTNPLLVWWRWQIVNCTSKLLNLCNLSWIRFRWNIYLSRGTCSFILWWFCLYVKVGSRHLFKNNHSEVKMPSVCLISYLWCPLAGTSCLYWLIFGYSLNIMHLSGLSKFLISHDNACMELLMCLTSHHILWLTRFNGH